MRIRPRCVVKTVKGVLTVQVEPANAIDGAIAWHVRLADADEGAWAAFIAWLEASPAHADAYDRVAAMDRAIGETHFPAAAPAVSNDNAPAPRRWLWPAGGIAAAAALALAFVPGLLPRGSQAYQVATRDGEHRVVALADGSSIELSGGTKVTLDRADARVATLDQGEALFHIRHDAAHPFQLRAGETVIRDLGTVFNVAHTDQRLVVAVAEGAVLFQPGGAAATLRPGEQLTATDRGEGLVRSRIAPALVGGWRSGRLSFDGEALHEVAATVKRLYGTEIALEGRLPDRPFTGVLHFSGAADRDVPHLAALIGATWRREAGRWILAEQKPNTP